MKRMRLASLAVCLLTLAACGGHGTAPLVPESEADQRWKAFETASTRQPVPMVLSGSLRFGPIHDTRRVTYLLWGNGSDPIRLDVQAGVGTTVAKARVANGRVLVYLPEDHKAYAGTDAPDKALRAMGLPLPLGVGELNAFLAGRYAEALRHPHPEGFRSTDEGIVYTIRTGRDKSELTLSEQGLPVRWKLPHSWDVRIAYDDGTRLPRKVEGELGGAGAGRDGESYRMVLLIKERRQPRAFAAGELELPLPVGTPLRTLDDE